jgi:hypothetical protein
MINTVFLVLTVVVPLFLCGVFVGWVIDKSLRDFRQP